MVPVAGTPSLFDVALFARLLLAGVFLVSATTKLKDLNVFFETLAGYRLLSPRLLHSVGLMLVGLELALGLAFVLVTRAGVS